MADKGAADGSVGVDHMWKRKLAKLLAETPRPLLLEAVKFLPIDQDDMDDLEAQIEGKRVEWRDVLYSQSGSFKLPISYSIDFAIAIHIYTLANPAVFNVVNKAMFNPARRKPGSRKDLSPELLGCLPYIKFLDAALEALPSSYIWKGEVKRGVQWVYPSPEKHDPRSYFANLQGRQKGGSAHRQIGPLS